MKNEMDWESLDEESHSIALSLMQAAFLCENKGLDKDFFMGFAKASWEWMKRDPDGCHAFWLAAVNFKNNN